MTSLLPWVILWVVRHVTRKRATWVPKNVNFPTMSPPPIGWWRCHPFLSLWPIMSHHLSSWRREKRFFEALFCNQFLFYFIFLKTIGFKPLVSDTTLERIVVLGEASLEYLSIIDLQNQLCRKLLLGPWIPSNELSLMPLEICHAVL